MFKMLFHPHITMGAFLAGLTALAAYGPQIAATFGPRGLIVEIVLAVLLAICTYGRSPSPPVDNNTPK